MNWRSTNRTPDARAFNRSGTMNQRGAGGGGGLPAWTQFPYWAFDNIKVPLLVGQEVTIYGDTLINVPIENELTVEYTCAIGSQSGTKDFVINPIADNTGEHQLTCLFKQAGKTFLTKNITLEVVPLQTATLKMLMVGDSLVYQGHVQMATAIQAIPSNVTFVGRQGTTIKHEGIPGFTFSAFVTQPTSPFVKDSVLNIPAYFTDNTVDVPDYVWLRLGVNDMFTWSASDITPQYMAGIISRSKQLIDGFLALNSTIKVILGLTTICESTVDGWNYDYDETIYKQDKFIELIHRFWIELSTQYVGYDSRVSFSTEVLHLDRDLGYTNNGVHPNTTVGFPQLGTGLALSLNRELSKVIPVLTVEWQNDYAAMTWDDIFNGDAEYEIYESKNGEAYTLVATTASGATSYNNSTWMNANMNFRIRAKIGTWYSEYSNIVNIATPIVVKSNQSTLVNAVISFLNIAAGETVNINWGDGTNANYTSNNTNITKTYSSTANPYYITFTGDLDSITNFSVRNQVGMYGDLTKVIWPSSAQYIQLDSCAFTGVITNWVIPSGLIILNTRQSANFGFTGTPANWTLLSTLDQLIIGSATTGALRLSGDISTLLIPASATVVSLVYNQFTKLPRGSFRGIADGVGFTAFQNSCPTQEVDDFLVYLDNYFTDNTPIKNAKFTLNGTGMGIPSATGLAAKSGIEAKFTAAGFVATITVNS